MKVTLIGFPNSPEAICARAAAICTQAKPSTKLLLGAVKSGHTSVLEHVAFTFLVTDVSRVLLAQLTRHRIASFSVESQRYAGIGRWTILPESVMQDDEALRKVKRMELNVHDLYEELVQDYGIPEEDARYIAMQSIGTRLVVTMNARELKHFFALRMCTRAQAEIRELATEMFKLVQEQMPNVFAGKSHASCDQYGFCPEHKSCGRAPKISNLLALYKTSNLNYLRDIVYADAEMHGLWSDIREQAVKPVAFGYRYAAIERIGKEVKEALEACNDPEHYADELADIIIMALSSAGFLDIDIDKAVQDKIAFNKTRPYGHKEEKTDDAQ